MFEDLGNVLDFSEKLKFCVFHNASQRRPVVTRLSICLPTAALHLPHPFLLPCCLPKPLAAPRPLHGPFPFVYAPAHPGVNLAEPRESGVNAHGWPRRSSTGWEVDHIGWSVFGGEKQPESQKEGGRERNDAD